jgi:hypothetical protein
MPIGQFLKGEEFDPETTRVMGVAFETACVALQLRGRRDPVATAMVAEKIIALAKTGERCATALSDGALSELGYSIVTGGRNLSPPPAAAVSRQLRPDAPEGPGNVCESWQRE